MFGVILFLHLVGVALLVASVATSLVALLRIQTAATVRELRSLVAGTKRVEVVIIPAMLLLIATGLYLVSQGGRHGSNPWSEGWVITSLVVTGVLGALGPTVEASDDKRLRAAIANATSERPHADLRQIQVAARPTYIVFFGTAQIAALLFLMSNRPDTAVAITACIVAATASVIAASIRLRSVRHLHPEHSPA
jgi:hypothetical protein